MTHSAATFRGAGVPHRILTKQPGFRATHNKYGDETRLGGKAPTVHSRAQIKPVAALSAARQTLLTNGGATPRLTTPKLVNKM